MQLVSLNANTSKRATGNRRNDIVTIPIKDQKMLWGRAAGRCSIPTCRNLLVQDDSEVDDPALIGENCHIVAESADGPRGESDMAAEERNSYQNLILCCRNHHAVIDKQPAQYTVAELHRIKTEHEEHVNSKLQTADPKKLLDEEFYGGIIDEIAAKSHFNDWLVWSSWILSCGQPELTREYDNDLFELRRWLAKRPKWPGRYPKLELAIVNFANVLKDFRNEFRRHAVKTGDGELLMTEKFYKILDWDEARYARLLKEYEFHVDLVQDLMLELTRAANLLIELVREFLLPNYMHHEGDLMIQTGPTINLQWEEVVVRYGEDDLKLSPPYPGQKRFLTVRTQRDRHFGKGESP